MMTEAMWPELLQSDWSDTQQTLHLWTQIVGKIRLKQEPLINHWWNVTLYVTTRGLTTSPMPYEDGRSFAIDFDFVDHELRIEDLDGHRSGFALKPMTVACFYEKIMATLHACGIDIEIHQRPSELPDGLFFSEDTVHAAYDRHAVERFFRIIKRADRLMKRFRASFLGKASPVHFFWGSFDLATTRFSGRHAPVHPGGIPNLPDSVTREAYSHEEHSVGFWPGGCGAEAAFYAYAYPEPAGFAQAQIAPSTAAWSDQLKEFLLPYESVRHADDPDAVVLQFFATTYERAATLAAWDRKTLERV